MCTTKFWRRTLQHKKKLQTTILVWLLWYMTGWTALITANQYKIAAKQENVLLYKGVQINNTVNNQLWLSSSKLRLSSLLTILQIMNFWSFSSPLKVLAPNKTCNVFNLWIFIYTCNLYRNQLILYLSVSK